MTLDEYAAITKIQNKNLDSQMPKIQQLVFNSPCLKIIHSI